MTMYGIFPPVKDEENLCQCENCFYERHKEKLQTEPFFFSRMFLCSTCGNKRCPHATDHSLACTNSNEAGQSESSYP